MNDEMGYSGPSLKIIEKHRIKIGDSIIVVTNNNECMGTLLPRYQYVDNNHLVIKLKSGYNIGVDVSRITNIRSVAIGTPPMFVGSPLPRLNPELPKVSIISTGGTIASRVDYRTGAVHPALTASELYATAPELAEHALIDAEVLYSIYSENITPKIWTDIAQKILEKLAEGYRGVIITHGTDTMAYTSAALSFALANIPIPVVLVGAQRSSDRPSSDSFTNLLGAVHFTSSTDITGVYLIMHSNLSDDDLSVHLGTKVRKNHTSARNAFESVNCKPAAYINGETIKKVILDLPKGSKEFKPLINFEEKVALIKFHPGFNPKTLDFLVEEGYRGLIIEGTGLGHVNSSNLQPIKRAISSGLIVGMTSQCIWGRTRMTVYDTGRDLLDIGVIPLQDMLPETALVKLMWALGNFHANEVHLAMMREIFMEYSSRSSIGYIKE